MSVLQRPAKGTRRAESTSSPPTRSLPKRPKPYMQMVGAALVALVFAALAGYLYLQKGGTTQVLGIDANLPPGHVLTQADFYSADVAGVTGSIPVSELSSVIGKVTTVGLVKSQVLTHADVATANLPSGNQRVLSVGLSASRLPATLTPGATVDLLAVAASAGGVTSSGKPMGSPTVLTTGAEVYSVSTASDGSSVVTLVVNAQDAPAVAAYAAAGQVTVVQVPTTGSGN